jgi:hypothetical protein
VPPLSLGGPHGDENIRLACEVRSANDLSTAGRDTCRNSDSHPIAMQVQVAHRGGTCAFCAAAGSKQGLKPKASNQGDAGIFLLPQFSQAFRLVSNTDI